MVSFDIKYLFTNKLLMETVDTCLNQCKENLPFNLTISQFKSLLETAVKESVFVFNNKLYPTNRWSRYWLTPRANLG